jgi:hypothetical protein
MRITAALSWWNEKPEDLIKCIKGMTTIADSVVAVDGSYRRWPNGTPKSSDEEVTAITDACKEYGLECLILQPNRLWKGEIEKRSYLMSVATCNSDWVAVFDTDHIVLGNREEVRKELESYSNDVCRVSVLLDTPVNPDKKTEEASVTNWHLRCAENEAYQCAAIFRSLPGFRVERFHWWYSAIKDNQRMWIPYGGTTGNTTYPEIESVPLAAHYKITHTSLFRTEKQILSARAYYNDRVKVVEWTGQEEDVPGLPDPVWDYETLPF